LVPRPYEMPAIKILSSFKKHKGLKLYFQMAQKQYNSLTVRQLHWAESDLCNRGRVEKAYSPVTLSQSDLSKPVTRGQNNNIKMGENGSSNS
jgi:hypothetical protein